ncbi:helix-turn-helix domain-containing protein [Sulfitobacter sp. G21635-S1]|jgi:DNA-binding transcriptional MocR family regulator|uniref:helix-turn-helix domain-containing protein n=1 Tax=Sulfitobacter sp. G21635-S1 TaxID=3014043 RepID=UPI0022AE9EB5|nr:helix-turn-helix domain-containing protein [Sulfitobacter sp. G21635-S1]MCZ4258140.1 helix-turn-helix domain-containing protein [Sulfitobacter sp. G21635-S1]
MKSGEGQFAPLTYAMLKSDAWRSLSGAAVRVYLELHTRFNGSNNGAVRLSYAEASKALGIGKATVQRAFDDLQAKGFLVLERGGNWYHRQAHEWRLTAKPVQKAKGREAPTNDWRLWREKIPQRGSGSDQKGASVVPFQNPKVALGSDVEPVRADLSKSLGSGSEH